jgi:hypothetical protein
LKSDGHGALISDGSEAAKAPSRSHQGSFPDPVFWLSIGNLLLLIFLWISIFSSVFCINPSAVVAVHMLFRLHANATSRMREQSISKKRAQKEHCGPCAACFWREEAYMSMWCARQTTVASIAWEDRLRCDALANEHHWR